MSLRIGNFVQSNRMVHRISQTSKGASVFSGDTEYQAEFVIFAAPTFLGPYLIEGMAPLHDFEYSPWLTANLTLEQRGSIPRRDRCRPRRQQNRWPSHLPLSTRTISES
jgi:hypothetical protein